MSMSQHVNSSPRLWVRIRARVFLHELHDLAFGPAAVVSASRRKEGAVTAVRGLDECDVWVGGQLGASLRKNTDERVVHVVDQQRGHCDALQNGGCNRAEEKIFCTLTR